MYIEKLYLKYIDWYSIAFMLIITAVGLTFVFSATYSPTLPLSLFFKKQLAGALAGLLIFTLFMLIDYRTTARWGHLLYYILIGLLLFALIKGSMGMGARRWIDLTFFRFQPSELAKLLFPPFVVTYLGHKDAIHGSTLKTWLTLLFMLFVSVIMIRKQPDLGTALLILFSGVSMLWVAGMRRSIFISLFLISCVGAPLSWPLLKDYQKKRILVYLGQGDSKRERYHIEQSKIAVGSGGLWGKGYLEGTQNKLAFLPESRTDFIFCVLCEEWGLQGALLLISLFLALFMRLIYLIAQVKNYYAHLLALGLLLPIIFSALINTGMVLGLLPVVGIPLPFMSYGLTHLWVSFAALGWIQAIIMRRHHLG